jgi:hypothetical protein
MEDTLFQYLLENIPVVVFMAIVLYIQRKDYRNMMKDYRKVISKKEEVIFQQDEDVKDMAKDVIKISLFYQKLAETNNNDHDNIKEIINEIRNNVKDIKRHII